MNHVRTIDFGSAPFQIIDGDRGKNYPKQDEFFDNGFCGFLSATNVTRNGFDFSQCQFITEQKDSVLRKGKLQRQDVVLTTRGTIGNSAFFSAGIPYENLRINSGMVILRCDEKEILPSYLYHFLRSPQFHGQVNSLRSGVAQPQLPIRDMRSIKLPLPALRTQQAISSILSAYDDLIENNRRRMALLEESARLLYREWFVRLRFPGHEHVPVTSGVPEGWDRISLDRLCRIRRGASPRPIQAYMDGTIPWFKIGDATSSGSIFVFHTAEHVTDDGAKKSVLLEPGELIVSNSATCGLPYFTGVTGCIHDGWLHLQPQSFASRELLYLCLQDKRDELVNSVSDGSTQKNLNIEAAGRLPILFPSSDVLTREFDAVIQSLFKQVLNLAKQNDGLRAARNLLLPRLMSGEIAV